MVNDHEIPTPEQLKAYFYAGQSALKIWKPDAWWKITTWDSVLLDWVTNNPEMAIPIFEWLHEAQPELAARCMHYNGITVPNHLLLAFTEKWKPRFSDLSRTPSPLERVSIGRALGALNIDQRYGVSGVRDDGLPEIDWIDIPGGEFVSISGQSSVIQPFAVSRYPITFAQYSPFVDERNIPPPFWNDPKWHISNHPVNGISLDMVKGFCDWYSSKAGCSDIRLPTTLEWEKAACADLRWTDVNAYFTSPLKANIRASQINRTSPVGAFPDGQSPYGIMDMSGNVLEWCIDANEQDTFCLRGGSWQSSGAGLTCSIKVTNDTEPTVDNRLIEQLASAAQHLSDRRHGALIVLERSYCLDEIIMSGERLDCEFSKEVVLSIFWPRTALHGGAIVVRNRRILAASCILPLMPFQRDIKPREMGLRHLAALGLSSISDAIVVVVSEETGRITLAADGKLSGRLNGERLSSLLVHFTNNAAQPDPSEIGFRLALDGHKRFDR